MEIMEGYEIIHSGKTSMRNGLSAIIDGEMKENIINVVRKNERITVNLILEHKFDEFIKCIRFISRI